MQSHHWSYILIFFYIIQIAPFILTFPFKELAFRFLPQMWCQRLFITEKLTRRYKDNRVCLECLKVRLFLPLCLYTFIREIITNICKHGFIEHLNNYLDAIFCLQYVTYADMSAPVLLGHMASHGVLRPIRFFTNGASMGHS